MPSIRPIRPLANCAVIQSAQGRTSVQRVAVSLVVTQVEHEQPEIQATVDHLVMQAAGPLEVITVAGGRHGFDFLDPGAESEDAVIQALSSVQRSLRA
jgi:hypothetical protein